MIDKEEIFGNGNFDLSIVELSNNPQYQEMVNKIKSCLTSDFEDYRGFYQPDSIIATTNHFNITVTDKEDFFYVSVVINEDNEENRVSHQKLPIVAKRTFDRLAKLFKLRVASGKYRNAPYLQSKSVLFKNAA